MLKAEGLIDDTWLDPSALERGTAVHEATQFYDEGDLDESTLDPVVVPYLDGWKKFRADTGCEIVFIETDVEHPTLFYKGRPDRGLIVNDRFFITDIKSGSVAFWHRIQLALYAMAYGAMNDTGNPRRAGVILPGNGNYSFVEYKDRDDYTVAKAIITLTNFRRQHANRHARST